MNIATKVIQKFPCFSLQCTCPFDELGKTAHIVTHHIKKTEDDLCRHLKNFANKHIRWIAKVGETYLRKLGISVEEYVNSLVELQWPLDELSLLIIARMYHRHIAIFLKNSFWSTRRDNTLRDCQMYLVYKGGSHFVDTCLTSPQLTTCLDQFDLQPQNRPLNLSTGRSRKRSRSTRSTAGKRRRQTRSYARTPTPPPGRNPFWLSLICSRSYQKVRE